VTLIDRKKEPLDAPRADIFGYDPTKVVEVSP
jgi:hypothetical protein